MDIFTSRYELSKVWKRKEAYVEMPGENLGFEVPKSLLSYKMMVVEKALSQSAERAGRALKRSRILKRLIISLSESKVWNR